MDATTVDLRTDTNRLVIRVTVEPNELVTEVVAYYGQAFDARWTVIHTHRMPRHGQEALHTLEAMLIEACVEANQARLRYFEQP